MKKKLLLTSILIFSLLLFALNFKVFEVDGNLYVRILHKRIYWNLKKHTADEKIVNKYTEILKNNKFTTYLCEEENFILYADEYDTLRIIKKDDVNNVLDVLYMPVFSYIIDGNYIQLSFKDDILKYADFGFIDLYYEDNLIMTNTIVINYLVNKYVIIKLEKLHNYDYTKIKIKINRICAYSYYWSGSGFYDSYWHFF